MAHAFCKAIASPMLDFHKPAKASFALGDVKRTKDGSEREHQETLAGLNEKLINIPKSSVLP